MDYYDLFHPLLSHGAHLFLAVGAGEGNSAAAFSVLERQIAAALAKRRPSGADAFDQAWFPVAAWLNEKLARKGLRIPDSELTNHKTGTPMGEEFFRRLDALLAKSDVPGEKSGRRDRIGIYHACLTLGYLGCYDQPDTCSELESYQLRCMDALAEANGIQPSGPGRRESGIGMGKLRGMTVFWALPFLATVGLFLLYRLLLTDLFRQVLE